MLPDKIDDQTITLTGQDGNVYHCRMLGVFEFENKQYALLLKMDAGQDEGSNAKKAPETILMQLIERGDEAVFRNIEDDEEFERVLAYIKSVAAEMDGAG